MAGSTTHVSRRLFKKSFQRCIIQNLATSQSNFKRCNPLKTAYRRKQQTHNVGGAESLVLNKRWLWKSYA